MGRNGVEDGKNHTTLCTTLFPRRKVQLDMKQDPYLEYIVSSIPWEGIYLFYCLTIFPDCSSDMKVLSMNSMRVHFWGMDVMIFQHL